MLKLCENNCFPDNIDYQRTLNIYNLCYWFNGLQSYIFLGRDVVVVVDINGCYKIYAENCGIDYVDKLRWVLGLDEDLGEFFILASRDSLLKGFAEEFRGWRPRASDLWWGLLVAHCQRVASFKQGWRLLHNIVKAYGRVVEVGDTKVLRPPTPEEVLSEPSKLVVSGVGFRAEGILRTAKAIVKGVLDYEKLRSLPDNDIEKELMNIPHVGSYVARLTLILAFKRYSLPPVDKWVRAIISKVYGVEQKEKVVEVFLRSRWGKWSGLAVYATTIALDAQPLSIALKRIDEGSIKPRKDVSPSPSNMGAFCRE
jgi:3-methyladenine DNA glycosylase/8-oxoguanine DNA glycosylase